MVGTTSCRCSSLPYQARMPRPMILGIASAVASIMLAFEASSSFMGPGSLNSGAHLPALPRWAKSPEVIPIRAKLGTSPSTHVANGTLYKLAGGTIILLLLAVHSQHPVHRRSRAVRRSQFGAHMVHFPMPSLPLSQPMHVIGQKKCMPSHSTQAVSLSVPCMKSATAMLYTQSTASSPILGVSLEAMCTQSAFKMPRSRNVMKPARRAGCTRTCAVRGGRFSKTDAPKTQQQRSAQRSRGARLQQQAVRPPLAQQASYDCSRLRHQIQLGLQAISGSGTVRRHEHHSASSGTGSMASAGVACQASNLETRMQKQRHHKTSETY